MFRLSSEEGLTLLAMARRAIVSAVSERQVPDLPPLPSKLNVSQGTFVTLRRAGKLRGCVGQLENAGPLADGVIRAAINAALHDCRFPPVGVEEIETLEIEISVLSPPEKIAPDAIVAGRHGVLVVRPPNRGVFLPQVATERGWSGRRLLEETCAKANLSRDGWRDPATQVFAFTTEIFSEAETRTISGQ